jgi:hypothetical protein
MRPLQRKPSACAPEAVSRIAPMAAVTQSDARGSISAIYPNFVPTQVTIHLQQSWTSAAQGPQH